MENGKKPKSVEEIILKYGVQSISTEAANDILDEEGFMNPPEPQQAQKKGGEAAAKTKKKFVVNIPESEMEATQELPADLQAYSTSVGKPGQAQAAQTDAAEETGRLDTPETYFIPDAVYYTDTDNDRYEDEEQEILTGDGGNRSYYAGEAVQKENLFVRFFHFLLPWKGDRIGEIIRKIIFLAAVVTLIVSASILLPRLIEDWQAGRTDSAVAALYHNNGDEAAIKQAEEILGGPLPAGLLPEFALLYANNQDIVGWVSVPDTVLDYPIARSQDNTYYLNHDYYKKSSRYGVPFMDYQCGIQPLKTNTVIYGHHMNNGTVFSALDNYKTLAGYQKHPVIDFNTLYERHKWKVFAAFITNDNPDDDNGYHFNYMVNEFADENDFNGFIQGVQERSLFLTDIDVAYGDKLLTLQTCTHEFNNARLIVVARMVREGEDPGVDVSSARENPNPRYPQAYYTKHGMLNPFGTDGRWYPSETTVPATTAAPPTTSSTTGVTTAPTTTTTTRAVTTRPYTTTTQPSTTKPTTTKPTTTKPTTTEPPSTEPPSTEPPATLPPATLPPEPPTEPQED